MAAALTHDDALDRGAAVGAGLTGSAENVEFVGIAASAAGHRIKISLAGSQ